MSGNASVHEDRFSDLTPPAAAMIQLSGLPWSNFWRRAPICLLVLLLAALSVASEVQAQDSRRVSGSVLAAADSARLARVEVALVGGSASAVTDAAGHFALPVPVGPV